MKHTINAADLRGMIVHGAALLNSQKQLVNELNVFPVPDGDTGTNMSMTINAASDALKAKDYPDVSAAAGAVASALLRGARGNSGVILSLLFRGFAKGVKDKVEIDGRDFALALDYGVAAAYKAVMKPAEGTILTVSRLSAAGAAAAAREDRAVESVLVKTIEAGQKALDNTVNQNPVLKKAGVVDAGGKGFLLILQGMLDHLQGKEMPEGGEAEVKEKADFAALGEEDITFDFDTVFIVRKKKPDVDLDELRAYLNSIGDSLVIGEDDEAFKVHVHTDTPGDALNKAQEFGVLELCKIENMRTQYEDLAAGKHVQSTDDLYELEKELEKQEEAPVHAEPEKAIGFVAVCAGEGLANTFKELGADQVISGGQTMNPSTQDILAKIDATPAHTVYVLPNNKNIIMAAEQCIPLCKDKKVIVIPSKTVPQGISALLAAMEEDSEEANTAAMTEAIGNVHTSEVTYAARDSDFDGFEIKQGDYMALSEHKLFATAQDIHEVVKALAEDEPQQNAEFITVIYGADVKEEEAQKVLEIFQEACPKAEVVLLNGGQPVYYYMISAE